MSANNIRRALIKHLETLAPAWALKGENRNYTPTEGTPYHRFTFIPNTSSAASFGSGVTTLEEGIFQIDVMYPKDRGANAAFTRADLVRNHFFTNSAVLNLTESGTTLRILEKPSIHSMIVLPDQPFVQIPVDVHYMAFIPPA